MLDERVISAAKHGDVLDLSQSAEPAVDADVLRDVLLGQNVVADPRGVRLHGAVVVGELDLTDLRTTVPLVLTGCVFEEAVSLVRAHLSFVDLSESTIPAVAADSLHCEQDLVLSRVMCAGGIDLTDAKLQGCLLLTGAHLAGDNGAALDADRLSVAGFTRLDSGFHARADSEIAAVRMHGARIGGQLTISGAHLINTVGPAFGADHMAIGGRLDLAELRASSACADDTIRLRGARVQGQLDCQGARLSNTDGPAFGADTIVVDSDALFEGCQVRTSSQLGSIRLLGARIAGSIMFGRAWLGNTAGPAFVADKISVGANAAFHDGFIAQGAGDHGSVRMPNARIAGQLSFSGAHVISQGGTALWLQSINVSGQAFFNDGFRAEASGNGAALDLYAAHCAGELSFQESTIVQHADDMLALDLSQVAVVSQLFLPLAELPHGWLVDVDGLRYRGIPRSAALDDWLTVLRTRTASYTPQPYQHLATVYHAAGHEPATRRILIAQQDDLRSRGELGGPARRCLHALSGILIGYGYQSWRALIGLLATVALALLLTFGANAQGALSHAGGSTAAPCNPIDNVGLAADLAIPLLSTGVAQRCAFDTNTTAGQWYQAGAWSAQLLGWAFATLFVAGFTGLVRKAQA